MSRYSLLDFYREIINSEKSFDIDYKNLSKQLIERIDKAIELIKIRIESCNAGLSNDEISIVSKHSLLRLEIQSYKELLEILGGE